VLRDNASPEESDGLASPSLLCEIKSMDLTAQLRATIRDVQDFPKPGIVFKDITPVLADGPLFRAVVDRFADELNGLGVTKVVGIDARGFIFAGAVACKLGLGFIPIRKKGKLPWTTRSASYSLEYGESVVEIHVDAVEHGEKVALIDDVLATGGTAAAAIKLLGQCGAEVVRAEFLMELGFLGGRANVGSTPVVSLVIY
jgi:adenine phosphoribosyltransferase